MPVKAGDLCKNPGGKNCIFPGMVYIKSVYGIWLNWNKVLCV